MNTLSPDLISTAKWAFSARRIPRSQAAGLDPRADLATAGELLLGRVLAVGQHQRIQLTDGRPSALYEGDIIAMPCGARYAPDQFEGLAEIAADGCDMLAGGGCLGRMTARHARMKPPTRIEPLGRLTDATGRVLTTADHSLPAAPGPNLLPVILVVGTSMNSGKTTATMALTHGLARAGWSVAALKGTGTGSFGDVNEFADAGARFIGDFTDAGMVTTYLEPLPRIRDGIARLLAEAERRGCDIAVMELADGIFQRETAALLADRGFMREMAGVIFACGDAVAAAGGIAALARNGIRPLRMTGMVSCSPLASAEAIEATGLSIVTRAQLMDPAEAEAIAAEALARNRVIAA